MKGNITPSSQQATPAGHNTQAFSNEPMGPPQAYRDAAIDPALASEGSRIPDRTQEAGYKDAIKAWSRFRFVRAGWFTPGEAIDYIE